TYIVNPSKTGSENSFKFTPSNLQRGCTLELDDATGNWTTSAIDTILPDTITKFDFIKDEIMVDSHTKDFAGVYNTFEIESNLADHILDWYFNLPYELSVTGYDVDYDADNNEWQFPAANLKFYITEDYDYMLPALAIAPITIEQPITPGKYEVKFSLSDYGVSSNYILNVVSDASTSDTHNLDITITNNTSNNGHIRFGDQITIDTNINKNPNLIETLVLENEYEFYVNDKLVYSGIEDNHTLTIEKALFNEGENVIKVLYGGSNTVERLIGSTVVDVKKSEHVINLPLELNVTYDGKPHALTATIETLPDVEPIVYYYTDSAYTAGETTTPPVNVGTYYVKAVLPENEYYTAKEATGTITIQKATPKLSLSGIPKNNNDLEVSVSMLYPKAGQIPNGKIQLNLVDAANSSQSSTVELKNGSLTHTFKNVAPGKATVIATYIPEINENGFVYNDPYYNEVKDVSETFEVVKDYIPVQDIEFIAPELQFYVQLNEVDYQNLTDMQLPVVITPNNASNQAITWTSSDPSVITINADGKVEAHKPGQSIITAIAKGANVMHTCEVRVLEMTEDIKPVKSISFDKLSMNLDLTTQLSGVINATLDSEPADIEPTNTDITWKSMDTSVAQIEATSDSRVVNVVAKGEGTTTVIAVTKDGAKVATCEVTVTQDQLGSGGDSDSSIPDTEKPEGNQPEVDSPETDDTPEGDKPGVDSPETDDTPEGDKPEVDSPETETPGGNQPETNKPEVDETPNNGGSGSGSGGSSNNNSNSSSGSRPSGGVSEGSNSTKTETDTTEDTISSDSNQQSTITIEKFTDIQNHWAKDDIQFVIEKGLFKGISETHFGVNQSMTRGMFVTVLHRLSGEPQVGKALFSDVKSNFYYADAVSWAHELGVVSGVNQTKFMPEQNITREQLVVMLYKYARAVSNNFEEYQEEISQFKDAKSVSNWSKDAMEWAVGAKILKGDTNNQLKPKANITRGEVAVILKRFCDKVVRN
ncbi:MAG: S-layer homology domain-containing protein, partial [Cellulosilyticum sp.]|nr:S-layer homology domain-containing protein [Cellulosilyticum sp.]